MVPELGSFSIILALCFAFIQMAAPLLGYYARQNEIFADQPRVYSNISFCAAWGQFIFLACAMIFLMMCFFNNDLSVVFVKEHSHHLLPLMYRLSAAWGGHEGSLLLWCLILSGWTVLFIIFCRLRKSSEPQNFAFFSQTIVIQGLISFGFNLFLFTTSNPFRREFPTYPIVGDDLTPILQDPGLIFHPPMLYLGYVGFSIGFAFAVAALLQKQFEKDWAYALRPWIILPWSFLGCGIVLGSWWAYRELGWGGWWFWDPVENASLLPWLTATALIHSLIVSEKRNTFKGWTILLALLTFALSLIGTFLVRSGVLVSVHAFASDPARGMFLLGYLTLLIGGSFLLYGARITSFYQAPQFKLISRETLLLLNSVFLITAVATILIGTLYPIILDALNLQKISVGEPYFNFIFMPLVLVLLLLMGVAPHVHWGHHSLHALFKNLRIDLLLSLVLALIVPKFFGLPFHLLTFLGISFSAWVIIGTLTYCWHLIKIHRFIPLKNGAMIISHIGIAILALGITINKSYSEEKQIKISVGEQTSMAGYDFLFKNIEELKGPNYKSITANFMVKHKNTEQPLATEQRIYLSHDQVLSKPGILVNIWRDIYLALGGMLDDEAWSVRIYYKPFVRWIWFGGFMLLIGGLFSLLNYFLGRRKHD